MQHAYQQRMKNVTNVHRIDYRCGIIRWMVVIQIILKWNNFHLNSRTNDCIRILNEELFLSIPDYDTIVLWFELRTPEMDNIRTHCIDLPLSLLNVSIEGIYHLTRPMANNSESICIVIYGSYPLWLYHLPIDSLVYAVSSVKVLWLVHRFMFWGEESFVATVFWMVPKTEKHFI